MQANNIWIRDSKRADCTHNFELAASILASQLIMQGYRGAYLPSLRLLTFDNTCSG